MEINEKTRVIELINECSAMEKFFADRNMYCRTCKGNVNCTLKKVAYYYGLLPVDKWVEQVKEYYKKHCLKPKVIKSPQG
jgi:predicted molibdopterin-dependent oxidoreductase YjgC